jgi:hypothetical protein
MASESRTEYRVAGDSGDGDRLITTAGPSLSMANGAMQRIRANPTYRNVRMRSGPSPQPLGRT